MPAERSVVALTLSLALTLLLWTCAAAAEEQAPEGLGATRRSLTVVDSAGTPIPGAAVTVEVAGLEQEKATTDQNGTVEFTYLEERWVVVHLLKPGFVATTWQLPGLGRPLPEPFVIALSGGHTVGGRVVDEQGKPIANADVRVHFTQKRLGAGPPHGPYANLPEYYTHTDREGRWECDMFPDHWQPAGISVGHPEFLQRTFADSEKPDRESLLSGTWTSTLSRGVQIPGTLIDERAKPIVDAAIGYQPVGANSWSWHIVHPDESGRFTLGALPEGQYVCVVVAKGLLPHRSVKAAADPVAPLRIRMQRGRLLTVTFLDENAQPATDITVRISGWVGAEAAEAGGVDRRLDAQGRWLWDGRPREEFTLSVYSDRFRKEQFQILPGRDNYTFTLLRQPYVRYVGRVLDAQTREPIVGFAVRPRSHGQMMQHNAKDVQFLGEDGRFEFNAPALHGSSTLEIRAGGYRPVTVGPYSAEDSPVEVEALLTPY